MITKQPSGTGSAPRMRPALRWALVASACAAAAVAWLPEDEVANVAPARAAGPRSGTSAVADVPSRSAAPSATAPAAPEPSAMTADPTASPAASPTFSPTASPTAPWPPLSRAAQAAWVPAPAPKPRAAAPAAAASVATPPPTPAFPYQWIGQIDEAGQVRVFLVDAQRLWAVAPGETVQPGWRVDGISAGSLQLTWLATGAAVKVAARP